MAEKKKSKKEKIDPYFLSNGKLRSEFSPDFEEKRSRVITLTAIATFFGV